jgi:hypothetical protein
VRWKDVDAQTDTELVDGKVQSLQAVAEKPAQRGAEECVGTDWVTSLRLWGMADWPQPD